MDTPQFVSDIMQRFKQLKSERSVWDTQYDRLARYILPRKESFSSTEPADFLAEGMYSSMAPHAAATAANTYVGLLWPDAKGAFELRPPLGLEEDSEVQEYFRKITALIIGFMDDPAAGLTSAMHEYFLEQVVFGTSGIHIQNNEDNFEVPLTYRCWDVKSMWIDENAAGNVDTIYKTHPYTARQMIEKYGADKVSKGVADAYQQGDSVKQFEVLQAIMPRMDRDPEKSGNQNMPIRSVHIEVQGDHLLKDSGFEELPTMVGRFTKVTNDKQGRSPGMVALPDILELNALREAIIVAVEKLLDPAVVVLDDGRLGGGDIDTSAGGVNVYNASGGIGNAPPISPINTVGELVSAQKEVLELKESVSQAFALDRLLDFNNETQMTAYETSVRNKMRGESLGSTFSRQETEVLTQLITASFNYLFKRGLLGVVAGSTQESALIAQGQEVFQIPESVQVRIEKGDFYNIRFVSPSKRFRRSEQLQGIFTTTEYLVTASGVMPQILDNLDEDKAFSEVVDLSGAPAEILRAKNAVKKIRESRAAAMEEQRQIEASREVSETSRNLAQAGASMKGDEQK